MQKIKLEREMKISHDCGGEFTLPDYEPAIGRMLSAECEPAPEGVYLKEAEGRGIEAELGGLSTFRILYIPEDGGAPHGAVIPCDYDTTVMLGPVGGVDSTVLCRAATSPENVFCRVTAPRKVQLRCRLGSKITVLSAHEANGDGDLPGELEVKRGGVEAMAVFSGASRDLLCSCALDGLPDGAAPVLCRAFVNVTECRPVSAGEYRCRGDVVIECLYEKDGELGTLRCRVEFDETVAIDGNTTPDETSSVRASGYVASAELHTDDSGSRVEVIYGLDVETVMPFTADVVYDAYSCTSPVAAEYDDTEFLSPAACVSGNVSVNEHIAKNVSGRVITSQARADISGITAERGRLRVNGELNGTSLIVSGGDYDVVPFSLPWSYELPAPTVADDASPAGWGSAAVSSLSVRADGELTVDAELAVSVTAACVRCERVLSSVSAAGEPFPAHGGFTVYYPSKSDTVWDIAKRFHVPCASVSADGNVNADGTPATVVII